ncbi:hypothetical protein H0G86_005616 [Trichoderma simmonsii]|uniref:Uncharacterized protein n=1 Tax=Trichoderma simmonsii TaxID=1491479 RepID=A0A8G0L9X1_9HYPO|nr:hypothetical protein H0G86_005616 [Trichoderma simmonsii]
MAGSSRWMLAMPGCEAGLSWLARFIPVQGLLGGLHNQLPTRETREGNRAVSPAARDAKKPIRLNKLGLQTGTEVRTDKWTDSMGIWTLSVWLAARLTPLPQSRQ